LYIQTPKPPKKFGFLINNHPAAKTILVPDLDKRLGARGVAPCHPGPAEPLDGFPVYGVPPQLLGLSEVYCW